MIDTHYLRNYTKTGEIETSDFLSLCDEVDRLRQILLNKTIEEASITKQDSQNDRKECFEGSLMKLIKHVENTSYENLIKKPDIFDSTISEKYCTYIHKNCY